MKKIPQKKYSNNKAFSLVEVLVAITILLLVVVTPMTIVSQANSSTAFANEQLIAFFLAQEGLELVEKGRNDLYLQYFSTGSEKITHPMMRFRSTVSDNVFRNCINRECGVSIANDGALSASINCHSSNNNCRLYYVDNNARAKYIHGGATAGAGQISTLYTRKIQMEPFVNNGKLQEMKVTSTVTWRTGSLIAGQQVKLVTYLANIYDTN